MIKTHKLKKTNSTKKFKTKLKSKLNRKVKSKKQSKVKSRLNKKLIGGSLSDEKKIIVKEISEEAKIISQKLEDILSLIMYSNSWKINDPDKLFYSFISNIKNVIDKLIHSFSLVQSDLLFKDILFTDFGFF